MILELIDWSVALLPVLGMALLFAWLDVFKLMTWREMLGLVLLGGLTGIASYPLSGMFLDTLPIGFSYYSRFAAPFVEEAVKGLAIVGLFAWNRIGFKVDAVISGFAVGAGFSVVENIIYLARFPELSVAVWMVRGLGTAVMHGTTLALLAAIAHELAERETRDAAARFDFSPWWFLPGYLVAVLLHGAFNQFPDDPLLAMTVTLVASPIVLIGVFRFGAGEAGHWLTAERDAHQAMVETLRQGRFPDDPAGRRLAALAAEQDPATAEAMREYVEVQAWLVMTAEDTLMKQADGTAPPVPADAKAKFDRLDSLRSTLGAPAMAALAPLLPFSRNDHWEVAELRERLR